MTKPLRLLLAGSFLVAGTMAFTLSTSAGATPRPAASAAASADPTTQVVFSRWYCAKTVPFGCRLNSAHLEMVLQPGYYVDLLEGHTSPFLRCSASANLQSANFVVKPDASDTQDGLIRVTAPVGVRFTCENTPFATTGDVTMFVVIPATLGKPF